MGGVKGEEGRGERGGRRKKKGGNAKKNTVGRSHTLPAPNKFANCTPPSSFPLCPPLDAHTPTSMALVYQPPYLGLLGVCGTTDGGVAVNAIPKGTVLCIRSDHYDPANPEHSVMRRITFPRKIASVAWNVWSTSGTDEYDGDHGLQRTSRLFVLLKGNQSPLIEVDVTAGGALAVLNTETGEPFLEGVPPTYEHPLDGTFECVAKSISVTRRSVDHASRLAVTFTDFRTREYDVSTSEHGQPCISRACGSRSGGGS